MLLITARAHGGRTVKRIGTESMTSAREWQARLLLDLRSGGTITIDEADPQTAQPLKRISTLWVRYP